MITWGLLLFTTAFSIYCMDNATLKYKYLFHPHSIKHNREHYRFLSHAFIHADYVHLALNMYGLYIFGDLIENQVYPALFEDGKLAKIYYILLYTGAIYAASISEYFKYRNVVSFSSLGASGAINALIFSFILAAPTTQLGLFFIPMPAWVFGIVYLGVSYYLSQRNKSGKSYIDRIGHEAHFWGAIYGIVFTGILKPELLTTFISKIIR